jgi:ribosomal protein S27AE
MPKKEYTQEELKERRRKYNDRYYLKKRESLFKIDCDKVTCPDCGRQMNEYYFRTQHKKRSSCGLSLLPDFSNDD